MCFMFQFGKFLFFSVSFSQIDMSAACLEETGKGELTSLLTEHCWGDDSRVRRNIGGRSYGKLGK